MTEREKMEQGMLYDANYDEELLAERARCKDLCFAYNQLKPSLIGEQEQIIRQPVTSVTYPRAVPIETVGGG